VFPAHSIMVIICLVVCGMCKSGSTIDQAFATDEEKQRLRDKFWTQVRDLVARSIADGRLAGADLMQRAVPPPPSLMELLAGRKASRAGTGNVKDMQDMAYLLYM
jgi:hypothetical protein